MLNNLIYIYIEGDTCLWWKRIKKKQFISGNDAYFIKNRIGYNFLNVTIKKIKILSNMLKNCEKNYKLATSEQSNTCVYKNVHIYVYNKIT